MSTAQRTSAIVPTCSSGSAQTLQRFLADAAASDGVTLSSLPAISQIELKTRNTLYRITLLNSSGRVLVLGGSFFPVWSEAQLSGSTLGGSCIKLGWVGRGFCLEFLHQGRRIVTTRILEIRRIESAPSNVC